ncbi:replication restart helicase PriA [Prevotella dentasini]
MKQINVILPLPLNGEFTYAVPDGLADKAKPGCRVLVPLGKSRRYVGIVASAPSQEEGVQIGEEDAKTEKKRIELKEILSVLDGNPVLLSQQMRLWNWIADYYMSPVGDVMKAALPSGLKQVEGFRPKTERFLMLAPQYRDVQTLRVLLDTLKRATKQQAVLTAYLQLCGVDKDAEVPMSGHAEDVPSAADSADTDANQSCGMSGNLSAEIGYDTLLNASHSTVAAIRSLMDKGVFLSVNREVGRINDGGKACPGNIKPLSEAQADAYNQILVQMMNHPVTLLHGVTSSGKTEIYIHLIQKTIDEHRQVLYLVPEIALTVQLTERLKRVFGNRLGIYHSRYSDAERVEIWQRQLSGHPYDVILGARSAVFLPFQRLGLVVIDEEHETSFKQQDPAPRYHARSAAIVLAQMYGARTLLGTATPSAESYHNARQGKYGLVGLDRRYQDIRLPEIEVVDIKDLRRRKMMSGPFSPRLLAAVRASLERGEQAILFQNRRGFAPMTECPVCGWVPKCPNCDVSLTHHRNAGVMSCHYCGYATNVPEQCPNCDSREIRGRGYGTEKIEDAIRSLLPEARVARMDLDTTRTRNAYGQLIGDFASGRTNLLIGTQMISKGLDFDKVSVVGILDADSMLNYPDFRAYEHAFTMMSQVSGRAGRKGRQGLVILQTKSPGLPVVSQIVHNDYEGFYHDLLTERRDFHYPPFYRLTYVYLKHRDDNTVNSAGLELGSRLREIFGTRVLGPDKPAVARVKTLCIRKIMLKLESGLDYALARQYLRGALADMLKDRRYGALQVYFDVDPL